MPEGWRWKGMLLGALPQLVQAALQHVLPGHAPEGQPGRGHGLAAGHHAQGQAFEVGPEEEAVPLGHAMRAPAAGSGRTGRPAKGAAAASRGPPGPGWRRPSGPAPRRSGAGTPPGAVPGPGRSDGNAPGREDLLQGRERLALRGGEESGKKGHGSSIELTFILPQRGRKFAVI